MKIERMLAIVLLLLNRRKVTAVELAERFEVSVRTIYRDIDTIDRAGIPIISKQGTGGGFAILDSYRLEKQLLTPDEIMSMVGVLKGVGEALGDSRVLHSGKKIEGLIPADSSVTFNDTIRIELSPWGYRGAQDKLLETIRKATLKRKLIQFTYRNSIGDCMERTAEPMTLVFKGSAWYLFAFCQMRTDYRMFRLSRMRDLFVLSDEFERRPYHYEHFMKRFEAAETETVDFELKFYPKARFLAEDGFPPEQIEYRDDGTLIVRAPIPMGEWIIGWMLSYGEHLEVIKPTHVREMLKKRLHAIEDLYR